MVLRHDRIISGVIGSAPSGGISSMNAEHIRTLDFNILVSKSDRSKTFGGRLREMAEK